MKRHLSIFLVVFFLFSIAGCSGGQGIGLSQIDEFIDKHLDCYKSIDDYIKLEDVKNKYSNYEDYDKFYIDDMDSLNCYASVDTIEINGVEYIEEICFGFFDSNEEEKKEISSLIIERYNSRYNNCSLNNKYDIYEGWGTFIYDGLCIELNDDESDKIYAEKAGVSVEEYRAEIDQKVQAAVDKATAKAENELEIDDNRSWLVTIAKKEIKKQLVSPNSAKFPFNDSFRIENMGGDEFIVTVDFTAKNAYGVEMNSTYSVWLKGTDVNNYSVIDIVGN